MQEKSKPNQADWEKHIEACEKSNESQKQYCMQQGLNYATFVYWRAKRKSKSAGGSVSFSEVKIKPAQAMLKLNLPNGIFLTIPSGADRSTLKMALELLGVGSC